MKGTLTQKIQSAWYLDTQARIDLYRTLTAIINRLPLTDALRLLHDTELDANGGKQAGRAKIIGEWRYSMRNAQSDTPFSSALDQWIPDVEVQLIRSGERNGDLSEAVKRASHIAALSQRLRAMFLKNVISPVFSMIQVVLFSMAYSAMITPLMTRLVPYNQWGTITRVLAATLNFLRIFLPTTMVLVIVLTFVALYLFPRWTGAIRLKLDDYVPFKWYKAIAGGNFLIAFSSMTVSGIPEGDALIILKRWANNWLYERVNAMEIALRSGAGSIGEAMYKAGMNFPDVRLIRMFRAMGAAASEQMYEISTEWIGTIENDIKRMSETFSEFSNILLYTMLLLMLVTPMSLAIDMVHHLKLR